MSGGSIVTLRSSAAALTIAAAVFLIVPAEAQAQRRGTVRVGVGVNIGRPRVSVSAYRYRPYYYANPWFYDSWYGYSQWSYPPQRYGYRYDDSASMRLQVNPQETEVFVDGYFAGTVDDFDGVLQRLRLEPGEHDIELYLAGHRPHVQRVYLQPTRTFTIRHEMVPLAAGDPPPARPSGGPLRDRRDDDEDAGPVRRGPGPRDRDPQRDPQRDPPRDPQRDPQRDPGPPNRGDVGRGRPADFGSLALRVQPGDADVLIDGERWQGGSPGERLVVELGAGPHGIEIRKDGYRTYMTEINVRPGNTTTLNVAMTKADK
jgi:hypothetical protein